MSRKRIITISVCIALATLFWWWEYGSMNTVPIEFLGEFETVFTYRNENNDKAEADLWTWQSYIDDDWVETFMSTDEVSGEEFKQFRKTHPFDYSQYTYIVSHGFTIEQLQVRGNYQVGEHLTRAIHGIECSPTAILLYRAPKCRINPDSSLNYPFSYIYIKDKNSLFFKVLKFFQVYK